MNGRVTKLLRKAAAAETEEYRREFPNRTASEYRAVLGRKHTALKAAWKRTPSPERGRLRKTLEGEIRRARSAQPSGTGLAT